ncbi:MAG: response regulator [Nocardioides sp.]|nr:response regulator [Nocardioides sp.]
MATIQLAVGDPDLHELVALHLELRGHDVRSADVDATWGALAPSPADLLVLHKAPASTRHVELVERCRQHAPLATMPILLVGVRSNDVEIADLVEAGVDRFIEIPFSLRYLTATIAELLGLAGPATPDEAPTRPPLAACG